MERVKKHGRENLKQSIHLLLNELTYTNLNTKRSRRGERNVVFFYNDLFCLKFIDSFLLSNNYHRIEIFVTNTL